MGWEAALLKRTWGGVLVGGDHEPAACPGSKESQQHPGLSEQEKSQETQIKSKYYIQIWAPHCKENIDELEGVQWKASEMVRGWRTHPVTSRARSGWRRYGFRSIHPAQLKHLPNHVPLTWTSDETTIQVLKEPRDQVKRENSKSARLDKKIVSERERKGRKMRTLRINLSPVLTWQDKEHDRNMLLPEVLVPVCCRAAKIRKVHFQPLCTALSKLLPETTNCTSPL
ncbi:hypothetical protein QYF61_019891 [Mycteria americana]|uniref:Uncharacterized protein n=1 Tax=Mycteria americana TaxID=33587 RepID=A0AAN7NX05_MYCAM|nr:hypothetical protein QYF61_019891 [Mycteria americana]